MFKLRSYSLIKCKTITSIIIESDALDAKTKEVFGDEKLVVLQ